MLNIQLLKTAILAGLGASVCISILATFEQLASTTSWLAAPFGASMVIIYALPNSPLAQPKNIVVGHLLTTAIGLLFAYSFPVTPVTLGLAVGAAITAMMLSQTTHPPAGANPIIVMLSELTWDFMINPVLAGTLIIVAVGYLYHRFITRQLYPTSWW